MKSIEVSVILPFRDHEHVVGRACRAIARHFAGTEQSYEIIAVDQGSRDNSQAVLALLRHELPGLRLVLGKDHGAGCAQASGRSLVLLGLQVMPEGLSTSLAGAVDRVSSGELDMVLVEEELLVCRRGTCQALIADHPGRRPLTQRRLLHSAQMRGFAVQSYGPESSRVAGSALGRVLGAVMPRATGLNRVW